MTERPPQPRRADARTSQELRAEKERALVALLGDAAIADLSLTGVAPGAGAKMEENASAGLGPPAEDLDRMRWHQNRLLDRVRTRLATPAPTTAPAARSAKPAPAPVGKPAAAPSKPPVWERLAKLVDAQSLPHEHPAVVALVLREARAQDRSGLLRQLPGPLSRAALQRLRQMS